MPRRSAQVVGPTWLERHVHTFEPLAAPSPEPHDGRRAERRPHHLSERRTILGPANARARIVTNQHCLDEITRRQSSKCRGAIAKWDQPVRQRIASPQLSGTEA